MCYYPFRIHKNLFIIVDLGRVPYDYGNNFFLKCLTKKECTGMLWDSVSIKYRIEVMENFEGFESLEGLENFKGFDNPAYEFEESINQPFEVKSGKKGSHKNFVGNEHGQNGASTETPENARSVGDEWYKPASDEEEAPEEFYTVGDEWYKPASDEEEATEEVCTVGDEWYKPVAASD